MDNKYEYVMPKAFCHMKDSLTKTSTGSRVVLPGWKPSFHASIICHETEVTIPTDSSSQLPSLFIIHWCFVILIQ